MTIDVQRIRGRAKQVREERAARTRGPVTRPYDAERDGETPEDNATLGATPISDEADRIARVEGISTFRNAEDMRGLGDPGGPAAGLGAEIERLGSELAEQVDGRVSDWLTEFREEMGGATKTPSQGFILGAVFGAIALALGVLLGGRNQNR
jgi:hypothetical protein